MKTEIKSKILGSILIILLLVMTGCNGEEKAENIKFSKNILLSINNGAPGFGTVEDCIDAEIFIYTDRTVSVVVYHPAELEIASFEMTAEDNAALQEIAVPEKIRKLKVKNDEDVCDGSSYHISLYDEQDERVCYKGGYMPVGEKFWEVYNGIKEILELYDISDIVEEYRESVRNGNINDVSMTDAEREKLAEYEEIADLLAGEWICESQSAYIKVYPSGENLGRYKIDIMADNNVHPQVYNLHGSSLFVLEYGTSQENVLANEDIPGETEEAITFTANMGEMDFVGVFLWDKGSKCLKYQMIEGENEWYRFYPYEEKIPIERYITVDTMGQVVKEMTGLTEMEEKTARQIALNLADLGVAYLYPSHCSIELEEQVYIVKVLANCLEIKGGKYQSSDRTVEFYLDTQGNPLYENLWGIRENE